MKSSVTITQIAEESGVSIATVSRFLNGRVPVSPEKQKRIEAVVAKYHFTPNSLARSLISKKTNTLGVILPDITNPYFSTLFQAVQVCAAKEGYSVFLCNTLFHSRTSEVEESLYFRMLTDKKADGILILGGQLDLLEADPAYQEALKRLAASVPVAAVGTPIPEVDAVFMEPDYRSGFTTLYNYLVSLGHTRIAFLGGQPGVTVTEERLEAYKTVAAVCGHTVSPALISLTDYYIPDGYRAACALLDRNVPFSAVIAMNDSIALGAVRAFADRGLSVPRDISVASCDQFFYADHAVPRITGIRRNHSLWGQIMIRTLLQAIEGCGENAKISLPPELVIRESCSPASSGTQTLISHF